MLHEFPALHAIVVIGTIGLMVMARRGGVMLPTYALILPRSVSSHAVGSWTMPVLVTSYVSAGNYFQFTIPLPEHG